MPEIHRYERIGQQGKRYNIDNDYARYTGYATTGVPPSPLSFNANDLEQASQKGIQMDKNTRADSPERMHVNLWREITMMSFGTTSEN